MINRRGSSAVGTNIADLVPWIIVFVILVFVVIGIYLRM